MLQQDFYFPSTCSVSTVSPKIVEISSDISINEGNNISLTCIATGRPEPTVTWRHISPKGKRSTCYIVSWEEVVELLAMAEGYGTRDLVQRVPHSWWPEDNVFMAPQRILVSSKQVVLNLLDFKSHMLENLANPWEMYPSCFWVKWW